MESDCSAKQSHRNTLWHLLYWSEFWITGLNFSFSCADGPFPDILLQHSLLREEWLHASWIVIDLMAAIKRGLAFAASSAPRFNVITNLSTWLPSRFCEQRLQLFTSGGNGILISGFLKIAIRNGNQISTRRNSFTNAPSILPATPVVKGFSFPKVLLTLSSVWLIWCWSATG